MHGCPLDSRFLPATSGTLIELEPDHEFSHWIGIRYPWGRPLEMEGILQSLFLSPKKRLKKNYEKLNNEDIVVDLYMCILILTSHVFASGSFTGPQKWGGVGWGINVHSLAHRYDVTPRHVHLHLRTYVMLLWRCFTSRRGWGGVGWGINVHSLAHRYDVTPRHVHLHLRTYVMLLWRCFTSRRGWGGVGWGINVHSLVHRYDVAPRHVHLHLHIRHATLKRFHVTQGVGWGGVGY